MNNQMEGSIQTPEERKSAKYKSFPEARIGAWGEEVREKHPDQLNDSIMARVRHISSRIDQYLPPYEKHYKVDQSLVLKLETSFDDLAQLYLEIIKEGNGGYFFPENKEGIYTYDPIIAFDKKLEEIHNLIINAEEPFFDEQLGKILVDSKGNPVEGTVGEGHKELSDDEKKSLHEKGTNMLKEALEKIQNLKETLESRSPLIS